MDERARIFAEGILDFWFDAAGWDRSCAPPADVEARWWNGGAALDADLTRRYRPHLVAAATLFEHEKQRAMSLPPSQRTDAQRRLLDAERASRDRGVPPAPVLDPVEFAAANEKDAERHSASELVGELARSFLMHERASQPDQTNSTDVRHRLALVILLDQFSRNIFRGGPSAFAFDRFACPLVMQLLDSGGALVKEHTEALAVFEQFFLIMPLEHSEVPAEQEAGVVLTRALLHQLQNSDIQTGKSPTTKYLSDALHDKAGRAELVKQFGRYPPRNAPLGRVSTVAEAEYLEARHRAMEDGAAKGKDQSNYIHLPGQPADADTIPDGGKL